MRVLDAGCGRARGYVDFPDAHVTGIDLDPVALSLNTSVDEKIVGDIQTYPLPPDTFDAIVCWDVLEHVPHPELALENLTRSLKPGGTLYLGLPKVTSPKGLATKFTPHRFHVWFYRHVFHAPNAGRPGYGPYPTHLHWSLRPAGLRRFAAAHELEVVAFVLSPSRQVEQLADRHPVARRLLQALWPGDPFLSECRVELIRVAPGARG